MVYLLIGPKLIAQFEPVTNTGNRGRKRRFLDILFNMRGSHKLKRVSWASDVNLCQVKIAFSDQI